MFNIKSIFFSKKNEQKERYISKENSMAKKSKYGNIEGLDYTRVQQAINKYKKSKKSNDTFTSLKDNLKNFSKKFGELPKDKKEEELRSEKFQNLSKDIKSLNNIEINEIITSMENQKEFSEHEILLKEVKDLKDILIRLEDNDIKIQGQTLSDIAFSTDKIDKIHEIINESFPENLEEELVIIASSLNKIENKIENIKFPTSQKIPDDYLKKDDFNFFINEKLKDLKEIKESSENLEIIPAKVNLIEKELKSLSEKIDNIPSSNNSQPVKHIPKEEKPVIELAKYMTDSVTIFENIAKEYVSKISEFDKLDKIKKKHQR